MAQKQETTNKPILLDIMEYNKSIGLNSYEDKVNGVHYFWYDDIILAESLFNISDNDEGEDDFPTEIEILEGTDAIDDEGFLGRHLTSVTLPSTLNLIGSSAFEDSALESVIIPGSVELICESAFAGCDTLVKAELGEGIKEIGMGAFARTALESIVLPLP